MVCKIVEKASKSRACELHRHQLLQAVILTCTDFKLEQFLGYVPLKWAQLMCYLFLPVREWTCQS